MKHSRLLKHTDQHGYAQCTPRVNDPEFTLPRQGSKTPWRVHQNYVKDLAMFRFGRVDDGTMEFKATSGRRNVDAKVAQHA